MLLLIAINEQKNLYIVTPIGIQYLSDYIDVVTIAK